MYSENTLNRGVSSSLFTVLLACSRSGLCQKPRAGVCAVLGAEIGWDALLSAAQWHGVMPLAANHLLAFHSDLLPPAIGTRLRAEQRAISQRNLWLAGELIASLRLLASRGIRVLPYKGPVLAVLAYGSLGLRQFRDLDLLLHKGDVLSAKQALFGVGYRPWHELPMSPAQERCWLRTSYEYPLEKPGVSVELHWQVLPESSSFKLAFEDLWERSHPLRVGSELLPALSAEDQLLLACVHGMKHAWDRLTLVCDVAELIRSQPQLDWVRLLQAARDAHAERIVAVGLRLAAELLDAPVPSSMLPADAAVRGLCEVVRRRLPLQLLGDDHPRTAWWLFLRTRERWRDRLRWLAQPLSPTPADWNAVRLPDSLFWAYWLFRPLRLMLNLVRSLAASLFTQAQARAKPPAHKVPA